ncbi:hypothetical protein D3C72_2090730 [compost metagenome]
MGISHRSNLVPELNGAGRVIGFKSKIVISGTLAAELGLKNEDVITHSNGKPLTSPSALLEMFDQIRSHSGACITVIRNKKNEYWWVLYPTNK